MKPTLAQVILTSALVILPASQVYAEVTCEEGRANTQVLATTDSANFTDHGDGTVTDNVTGLMWMRCSLGKTWISGTGSCDGSATTLSWQSPLSNAEGTNFAGHDDWRLPNMKELESIVERRCWSPAINSTLFPDTSTSSYYWTSSPSASQILQAWVISFNIGSVFIQDKTESLRVRLVRGGN